MTDTMVERDREFRTEFLDVLVRAQSDWADWFQKNQKARNKSRMERARMGLRSCEKLIILELTGAYPDDLPR